MKPTLRRLLFATALLISTLLLTSLAAAQGLACAPTTPPTGCAVVTLNPVGLMGDFYLGETPISAAQPAAAISVPAGIQKINVRNIRSAEAGFGTLFTYNDGFVNVSVPTHQSQAYTVKPVKKYIRGTLVLTCDIRNAAGAAVQCQVSIDGTPQPDLLAAGAKGSYVLDPGTHAVIVTLVGDQAAMWSPAAKPLSAIITASATPRAMTATFDRKALVTITLSAPTATADLYVDGALVASQVASHQLYVAAGSHKFEAKNVVDTTAAGVYRWKDTATTTTLTANTTRAVKLTLQKEFLLGFLSVTCQLTGLKTGETGHCLPTIDGTLLPLIENGKSATFNLVPGAHELSVDVGPAAQFGNAPVLKSVTIRAGQTTRHTARIAVQPVYDPNLRHTSNLPDDLTGKQVRFIYVLPSDGVDRSLDTNGVIRNEVAAFQNWMAAQTGGRTFRVDTYGGVLDVGFFRMSRTNEQLRGYGNNLVDEIARELAQAGLSKVGGINAVYYDGINNVTCGSAPVPGGTAALYLHGLPDYPFPCDANTFAANPNTQGYLQFVMVHEILHAIGMVPSCAPNHDGGHHVGDFSNDMMYAGSQPWRPNTLDVNHDDYYLHNNPACPDLDDSGWLTP